MCGTCGEISFDELCKVVQDVAIKYGIKRVHLIGSRAREDHHEGSDYDFCVLPPDNCGLFKMSGFFLTLRDSLGADVDIVFEDELEGEFANNVHRDMRLLYEA